VDFLMPPKAAQYLHFIKEAEMKWMGLVILAIGIFLFVQAAQADWTPVKRLTWTSGFSYVPAIAVDVTGNLHDSELMLGQAGRAEG
jgi:hypothetical protein